jgi:hypothetical protein
VRLVQRAARYPHARRRVVQLGAGLVDPPTTRMRPLPSGVAVRCARGVDMLAVAVQLPVAVPADEASGATAIASAAQMADATAFVRTMKPPVSSRSTRRG